MLKYPRRIREVGQVTRIRKNRNAYKDMVLKPEGKNRFRPSNGQNDIITIQVGLKKIGRKVVDCITVIMNLRGP
jgi:hypothetical protein